MKERQRQPIETLAVFSRERLWLDELRREVDALKSEHRISRRQIAKALGVSPGTLTLYLQGERSPSLFVFGQLWDLVMPETSPRVWGMNRRKLAAEHIRRLLREKENPQTPNS